MSTPPGLERLQRIAARLPEAEQVNIDAWGDHPAFQVGGKNFVFSDPEGRGMSLKLPKDEAAALIATDARAEPAGYGLGRHGWVDLRLGDDVSAETWLLVEEWVRTSYTMVAPRRLARMVLAEDAEAGRRAT